MEVKSWNNYNYIKQNSLYHRSDLHFSSTLFTDTHDTEADARNKLFPPHTLFVGTKINLISVLCSPLGAAVSFRLSPLNQQIHYGGSNVTNIISSCLRRLTSIKQAWDGLKVQSPNKQTDFYFQFLVHIIQIDIVFWPWFNTNLKTQASGNIQF